MRDGRRGGGYVQVHGAGGTEFAVLSGLGRVVGGRHGLPAADGAPPL